MRPHDHMQLLFAVRRILLPPVQYAPQRRAVDQQYAFVSADGFTPYAQVCVLRYLDFGRRDRRVQVLAGHSYKGIRDGGFNESLQYRALCY